MRSCYYPCFWIAILRVRGKIQKELKRLESVGNTSYTKTWNSIYLLLSQEHFSSYHIGRDLQEQGSVLAMTVHLLYKLAHRGQYMQWFQMFPGKKQRNAHGNQVRAHITISFKHLKELKTPWTFYKALFKQTLLRIWHENLDLMKLEAVGHGMSVMRGLLIVWNSIFKRMSGCS